MGRSTVAGGGRAGPRARAPGGGGRGGLVAVEQAESRTAGTSPAYVVGFMASGPADETALAPDEHHTGSGDRTAAVTELLVEPRWGRRGHGSRLLAASVDLWRADG